MAKFTYFEVSSGVFADKQSGDVVKYDNVSLMFTKRVNRNNMKGEKGEIYSVPINDLPHLFGIDVKFPAPAGSDYTCRIDSVVEFLSSYLGKSCTVEEISKKDRKIISYLEFDD